MSTNQLVVLGYNTHLFGMAERGILPQYQDASRAADIARMILAQKPDLVGLAEVWDDDLATSIANACKAELPFHWNAFPDASASIVLGSGLQLLSRYPITNTWFEPYALLAGTDAASTKGIAVAVLQLPDGSGVRPVIVSMTHNQADTDNRSYPDVRYSNLCQWASLLAQWKAARPGVPLCALGDFNLVAESVTGTPTAEYQRAATLFAAYGLTDCFRAIHPDAAAVPGYSFDGVTNRLAVYFDAGAATQQQRLDYVFASDATPSAVSVSNTGWTYEDGARAMDLSDHYPMQATLTLTGASR